MKFSSRDFLWLSIIVILAIGWGVDKYRLTDAARLLRECEESSLTTGVPPGTYELVPLGKTPQLSPKRLITIKGELREP
jgi:hypothetical protein